MQTLSPYQQLYTDRRGVLFTAFGLIVVVALLLFGLNFVRTHVPEGRYTYVEVIPYTDTEQEHSMTHILTIEPKRTFTYSMNGESGFARVRGSYERKVDGTVDFVVTANITEDETHPTVTYTPGQRLFFLTPVTSTTAFLIHWDAVTPLGSGNGVEPHFSLE